MKLNQNIINWLLEENNPSIRYRTLVELLDKKLNNPDVIEIKSQIAISKPVEKIFLKMHPDGYWYIFDKRKNQGAGDGVEYFDYKTTHFNLAFLAELGMDCNDKRILLAVNRYLNLQQEDGDFLGHFSCLYAYNLRAFIMMGFKNDKRIQNTINLLLNTKRYDGGYLCDIHEGKRKNKLVKSCIRGSIKALTAYAILPELWNTPRCKSLIKYFLKRQVYFRMGQSEKPAAKAICATTFPFIWRSTFLEALCALSKMGYGKSPELAAAWELLENKKDKEEKYILDWNPTNSYFNPGKRGMPNKWITLYANLALKYR